jgi:nucleoside-diphosphate-sugar epimerase
VLGWQPTVSLNDGLDRMIAHFAETLGTPKEVVLS